jgi:uncharacterized protein involved in exopolysaccharide biosynthesis
MLSRYRAVWIAPAVVGMLLSAFYVFFLRAETWSAKQSLIVRDDLLGQSFKPGRFDSLESMKSAQETILEIARKPQVIRKSLEQLGPASKGMFGLSARGWPSEEVIEDVQGAISFSAPNGAEFGKTEVIVLNTKASSRERSRKFIELLLGEIIVKVDEVRTLRLQSMETELTQVHQSALMALNESKAKLQEMDRELGTDIGAINISNDSQASDNTIKRDMSQIYVEKRQTESHLETLRTLLTQLVAARENPDQIVSISGDLIKFQPALDDLKKELVKTQRALAKMEGQYEPQHPKVAFAKNEIEAMKQQLYLELAASISGLESSVATTQRRLDRLNLELGNLDGRLLSLGEKRAGAVTLFAELKKRTEIANEAQSDLAEIHGLAQAKNAALLTRVDEPQVSTRPDGLGKKAMILAGALGGLMLGLGIVLMIAPPMGTQHESQTMGETAGRANGMDEHSGTANDSFFDSKSFEKIVTRAAAAAAAASAAAVQSASKAKQFFANASNKYESERTSVTSENAVQHATLEPTSSTRDSSVAVPQDEPAMEQQSSSEGTPSVKDLLAAASAMAKPAPIASEPMASSKSDVKEAGRSAKIVAAPPVAEESNRASFTETTKAEPKRLANPTPQSTEPTQSQTRKSEPTVSMSLRDSPTLDAEKLAAIQLAALRGETVPQDTTSEIVDQQVVKEEVPNQSHVTKIDLTSPVDNQSSEDRPALKVEVIQPASSTEKTESNSEQPEDEPKPAANLRAEPQTIVVSDVRQQVSKEIDEEVKMIGPLGVDPVAELTRRGPSTRPVDLAKSVESDDSTFVRINLDGKSEAGDANSPTNFGGNVFLNDRKPSQGSEEASDDMPVPDQIKKLSDSISKFAKPIKKKDDSNE